MTWLNPGCSEPRVPVAECVLSVCRCVLDVLVSDPGLYCSLALQDLKIALANTPSVHPLFVLYCIVYYKRERERECVCVCVCQACSSRFNSVCVFCCVTSRSGTMNFFKDKW